MRPLSSRNATYRPGQAGAIIVTVCLFLLFLLGFMGIALDFGRLFVVKTELQSAADACALAAAAELDHTPGSRERARNAGRAAAAMNFVNLQAAVWTPADPEITFRDEDLADTEDDLLADYAECRHTQDGVGGWLLPAMHAFSADPDSYPAARSVTASAVGTRGSAQTSCPIPVAIIPRQCGAAPCPKPGYGFTPGEWVLILSTDNNNNPYPQPGEMGWFNIEGTQSARDTKEQLAEGGVCGTAVDDTAELSTPGAKEGVAPEWNYRFGLYRGAAEPSTSRPDLTGFAYDESSWPARRDAYPDFVLKRSAHSPHPGSGPWRPATSDQHAQYGYNRRVVTVPVLSPSYTVIDFACMLMLEPMLHPLDPVYLEFLGNAGTPGNPCTTSGLAGALAGPLVPVLVQ